MDNKAYLDQIAVKGKNVEKKPILTPGLLKIIGLGLLVIVTLLALVVVVSNANKRDYASYESLYLRTTKLADKKSPIHTYTEKLKSSELRSWSSLLSASLDQLNAGLASQLKNEGADVTNISAEVKTSENALFSSYESAIEDAYLSGMLDRTYAYETSYQISLIISAEEAVISQSTDGTLKGTLEKSIEDLEILEEKFLDYSNKH